MEPSNNGDSPKFVVCDDDGRARITEYRSKSQYRVGDLVNLIVRRTDGPEAREGPYKVASVPSVGKYTLCLSTGQPVKNGIEFEGKDLEPPSDP